MKLVENALSFARDRGDFAHPTVQHLRSCLPTWIATLGTDEGVAEFESQFQTSLPCSVRFYFQNPNIAILTHAGGDLDRYLDQLSECVDGEPPYVPYYAGHPHLVLAFHNHSGGVAAVDLVANDSPIRFGEICEEANDLEPYAGVATVPLDQWLEGSIREAKVEQFHLKSQSYPIDPETFEL